MSKSNFHKKLGQAHWSDDEHTSRTKEDNFYNDDFLDAPSTGKKKKHKKNGKKFNHKHNYVEVICLYKRDLLGRPCKSAIISKRCSICGKLDGWKHPTIKDPIKGFTRLMTADEIIKAYKDLEVFEYD